MSGFDGSGKVPALTVRDGKVYANSRDVAAFFEKRHDHVLRDIDNLLKNMDSPILGSSMFAQSAAPDGQGVDRRTFDMTRDGFALLAMGFTGEKALTFKLRYIKQFNVMEEQLRNPALPDLSDPVVLQALIMEQCSKRIEADQRAVRAERVAAEKSEKAAGFDQLLNANGLYTSERAGAHFGISAKQMNKELARLRWIHPRGRNWLAHVEKIRQGLLEYKSYVYSRPDGTEGCKDQVMITPAGLAKLWTLLRPSEPPPPDLFGPALAAE